MLRNRVLLGLVPAGLLLSACASNDRQQAQAVPADTSGQQSVFTAGFTALEDGDNIVARQKLEQAYQASPKDPYDQENLAAAYQNTGDLGKALPLYRDVIANGQDLHPSFVTRPEVKGMTMAQIAQWNLKLAGVDEYGNALQSSQAAALMAPQSKYEIYFAFDRAEITPEAARIVSAAAKSAMAGNLTRIDVVGHTDTVGSAAYNQRLSVRRADAVRKALLADGVPSDTIAARGVGEADLAVPTPDGVREPKNRRVEISEEEAKVN
jgi:outer membrane protein OmpA-like peptidoglycan-associated protein